MNLFDLCVAKKLSGGGSQINLQDYVVVFERTSYETAAKCHSLSNPDHDLTWNELIDLFLNYSVTFMIHSNVPPHSETFQTLSVGITGNKTVPYSWNIYGFGGSGERQIILLGRDLDSAAEVIFA